MGRSQVRSQLSQFLTDGNIEGLGKVYTSFPKRIDFQINTMPGQKSRAAAVVFIEDETESRIGLGGATNGIKRIDYSVVVQIFHHSTWDDPQDAMDDFDLLIDAVKTRLRSDHRFGDTTGSLIWQGAEPAIDVAYGMPKSINGGATETWAGIRFMVTQIFNA